MRSSDLEACMELVFESLPDDLYSYEEEEEDKEEVEDTPLTPAKREIPTPRRSETDDLFMYPKV
jgi:hypothetical protein